MSILSMLLSFLGSIIIGVITDVFKTPAVETVIEEMPAPLSTIATPTDELLSRYGGLLDRD